MQKDFLPKANSFKNTFCIFKEVNLEEIDDLNLAYSSQSGSKYYYTKNGMYRLSSHWGRLANSKWRLEASSIINNESKLRLGYADFLSFFKDNNFDKLYYLEYNLEHKTINYQHKLSFNSDQNAILRTTAETTKRIKQARNILNLTNWSKHFEFDDLDILRNKIINELIYTDKSLEQIKRELQYYYQKK